MKKISRTLKHGAAVGARVILSALFTFILFPFSTIAAPPDLNQVNALRARVISFWKAYEKYDPLSLEKLLVPADLGAFMRQSPAPIHGFWVSEIRIAPDGQTAIVETSVKRVFPSLPHPMGWDYENQWVLVNGQWYFHFVEGESPLARLFKRNLKAENKKAAPSAPTAPPDATAAEKAALEQAPVSFLESEHNFGAVVPGHSLKFDYPFLNHGRKEVRIKEIVNSCEGTKDCPLELRVEKKPIAPGSRGTLQAEWKKVGPDQVIDKTIVVEFDSNQVFFLHFAAQATPPSPAKKQVAETESKEGKKH